MMPSDFGTQRKLLSFMCGFWTDQQFKQNWKGLADQTAMPHPRPQHVEGARLWSELWTYFDQHRLKASELLRKYSLPDLLG